MEYTGTALEKITGFFFALFLLALMVTAVNLLGISVAMSMIEEYPQALELCAGSPSCLFFFPLLNFARYRARKYMLSRTYWRGIRFGMDRGAWGYAARASPSTVSSPLSPQVCSCRYGRSCWRNT